MSSSSPQPIICSLHTHLEHTPLMYTTHHTHTRHPPRGDVVATRPHDHDHDHPMDQPKSESESEGRMLFRFFFCGGA